MPTNNEVALTVSFETTDRLSTANIRPEKISNIIQTFDPNKAQYYDGISVRLIKIYMVLITNNQITASSYLIFVRSKDFSLTFGK